MRRLVVLAAFALLLDVACERNDGSTRALKARERQSSREAAPSLRDAERVSVLTADREACRALASCLDEKGLRSCEPERVAYFTACIAPACAERYATLGVLGFVSRKQLCEYSDLELKAAKADCEKYVACMANPAVPMCAKPSNCEAPPG